MYFKPYRWVLLLTLNDFKPLGKYETVEKHITYNYIVDNWKHVFCYSFKDMKLHYGDLTDSTCLVKIINEVKPTEIYNLGAQSHVKVGWSLKYTSYHPFCF